MFDLLDKKLVELKNILLRNGFQTSLVEKAFEKAKTLHEGQVRKEGTPYIFHPVEVALILARLGFDENVVSGALLHDTIEDCGYVPQQLRKDFNDTIFKLVDCVSAIDKTKYVFDEKSLFEDPNFVKLSAEGQSFKKLIAIGKENPCGFAIKFADRLHNLRTISTFERNKQLEKVRETEKWVLPIAKKLNSEYFYRAIKNECFKIASGEKGKLFLDNYWTYHNSNEVNVKNFLLQLQSGFSALQKFEIKIKNVREYKVFEDLTRLYKNPELSKVSQGQILKIANYNIYILYSGISKRKAEEETLGIISRFPNIKIINAKIGGFTNKPYLLLQDGIKNKFNMYILSQSEYLVQKVGTLDGQNLDLIDEENINQLDFELIRVKTRSGEVKYIAKNSTVLDFAFKIHKDLGFGFSYAIVNKSRTKFPAHTRLNDGDQVEIVPLKNSEGEIVNNAKLKWFAYVNTEIAKRELVRYFETKLKNP